MDRTQAESAAEAILEPHVRAQEARSEELRVKRAAEDELQGRKRRMAWFLLAGSGIGVVLAHFTGFRFTQGILFGCFAGFAIGWLVTRRAA